jgi:hypothetical protein
MARAAILVLVLLGASDATGAASDELRAVRIEEAWRLACPLVAHLDPRGCGFPGVHEVLASQRREPDGALYYIVVLRAGSSSADYFVYRVGAATRDVTFVEYSSDIEELRRRYR